MLAGAFYSDHAAEVSLNFSNVPHALEGGRIGRCRASIEHGPDMSKFRVLPGGGTRLRLPILFFLSAIFATMEARTPATHIPGYSRARLTRMIGAGNIIACALALWAFLCPTELYTVGLSLCALLPLWALALEMRTRGALGFESRRGRRSALSLATVLLMPALALAVRAGIDLNFETYAPLIVAAMLTAFALFALFWCFAPQLRGDLNQGITIAMFAVAYCYGMLAFADVALDVSSGHDTQTVIDHKRIHVSGGPKGGSVWYQVKVDPEASPAGADWINTRPDLWDSFHRGDTVCVHVGAGLFAIPWFAV